MYDSFVGIDPGQKGGIAIIDEGGITAEAMPMQDKSIQIREICEYLEPLKNPFTVIEKVHAMPDQGVSSTFTFGRGVGELIGMLKVLQIPYFEVTPQAWKKHVLMGMAWKGNKGASIEYCNAKYPKLDLLPTPRCTKQSDGMADALCMAEYARWKEGAF